MIVLHRMKSILRHHVSKMCRSIKTGHFHAQTLDKPKVLRSPSDLLIGTKESGRDTSDGSFSGRSRSVLMRVNTSGEIEDPLARRNYDRLKRDYRHDFRRAIKVI